MRIAAYNIENLFLRARALNMASWADGRAALSQQQQLNTLFGRAKYTAKNKQKMLELLTALGLERRDDGGPFALLRRNRGRLLERPRGQPPRIVAGGRADWIGWVELKTEAVDEVATRMTAKVIDDVGADVLGVVEAESRPALVRFNEDVLRGALAATAYAQVMLIDGNDERGIDVGLMTRAGFTIESMRSHVDDRDQVGQIFSRDCAEYWLTTPRGNNVVVLVNHFKSKGFGSQASSNEKRRRQAVRVRDLYLELIASGQQHVAVIGDLNDTPASAPLAPLLQQTELRDISSHPAFDDGAGGERPGTYGSGNAGDKIDYVLLSPALFDATRRGGIFRMGVWGGKNGTLFPHYPEITRQEQAGSDHAAIWADIDV